MTLRSWETTRGIEKVTHRALYKSMGYTDQDLEKPLIGIANAWSTVVPGHYNLREISKAVHDGIRQGGGTPVEFGVIGACDGIAEGHKGTRYVLPTRDLIAHDIEVMVEGHRFDAIVLLGSCDKIIPGMLMAAARLDVPALLVNSGPSLGGMDWKNKQSDCTTVAEALGQLQQGEISIDILEELENKVMPTCGSCAMLGTANSMACVAEALGMMLPGTAVIPAVYKERLQTAQASGEKIVQLVKENITARKIITLESVKNAIMLNSAIGGSTNVALHIPAIAYEAEIEFSMDLFDQLSASTPLLAKINPAGPCNVADFYQAGGVQRVLKELESILEINVMTVSGTTLKNNLAKVANRGDNNALIKSIDNPYSQLGGLAVLKGNLCPDTAVTKPAAIDPSMLYFQGSARVFNSEEDTNSAIMAGQIKAGDVIVVRYEGPKGGPGMPEMFRAMKLLHGMGLAKKTALITDGRFSGTNNGCFVGHISPEAIEGGPLAIVKDGDLITIDVPNRKLQLEISDKEMQLRFENIKKPTKAKVVGYLNLYSKLATSAHRGAVIPHRD